MKRCILLLALVFSLLLAAGLSGPALAEGTEAPGAETREDAGEAATAEVVERFGGFTAISGGEAKLTYKDGVLTVSGGGVTLLGGGEDRLVVAGSAEITLDGVDIAPPAGSAVSVSPGATAVLILGPGSMNHLTGADGYAGLEAARNGEKTASVTIRGDGILSAQGGSRSAGIGGSSAGDGIHGEIVIESGTVNAQGGANAAGIGTAVNTAGSVPAGEDEPLRGSVVILGGTVTARGAGSGAGIGGGNHADSGKIRIEGGEVFAFGASGIGSGVGSSAVDAQGNKGPGSCFADVEILGGTVTARGAGSGAGVGGAMYSDGKIVISGGQVTASGGESDNYHQGGAGIGGGYLGHGNVTVSGGMVDARGGGAGAGIGGGGTPNAAADRGENGRRGTPALKRTTVVVSGTAEVTAVGGAMGGAGIGGGAGADSVAVAIRGGVVTAVGGAGTPELGRGGAGVGSGYAGASSGESGRYFTQTDTVVKLEQGSVTAVGGWGACGVGAGAENRPAKTVVVTSEMELAAYSDSAAAPLDVPAPAEGEDAAPEIHDVILGSVALGVPVAEPATAELRGETAAAALEFPAGRRSFARSAGALAGGPFSVTSGGDVLAAVGEEGPGSVFQAAEGVTDLGWLYPVCRREARIVWTETPEAPEVTLLLLRDGAGLSSAALSPGEDGTARKVWEDLTKYSPEGTERRYSLIASVPEGYGTAVEEEEGAFLVTVSRTAGPTPEPTAPPASPPPETAPAPGPKRDLSGAAGLLLLPVGLAVAALGAWGFLHGRKKNKNKKKKKK